MNIVQQNIIIQVSKALCCLCWSLTNKIFCLMMLFFLLAYKNYMLLLRSFALTQKNQKVKKEMIYSPFLSYTLMLLLYYCNFNNSFSFTTYYTCSLIYSWGNKIIVRHAEFISASPGETGKKKVK
jgi:hypothetical protein